MRTSDEFKEAFNIVGAELERLEESDGEEEVAQAIYDTLRWANGETSWDTVAMWLG